MKDQEMFIEIVTCSGLWPGQGQCPARISYQTVPRAYTSVDSDNSISPFSLPRNTPYIRGQQSAYLALLHGPVTI